MSSVIINEKSTQNLSTDEQTIINSLCKFYKKLARMGHREFKFDKSIVRRDSYLGGVGLGDWEQNYSTSVLDKLVRLGKLGHIDQYTYFITKDGKKYCEH